jgi:hypothetical protein
MSLYSHPRRLASLPCSFFHLLDTVEWPERDSRNIRLVCRLCLPSCSRSGPGHSIDTAAAPRSRLLPLSNPVVQGFYSQLRGGFSQ